MTISKLTIPCHFNTKTLNKINSLRTEKGIVVNEIYGVLSETPIGHGRYNSVVPYLSKEKAIKFRNYVKKLRFDFAYLMNAPYVKRNKDMDKIKEHMDWVVNEFEADLVVIASHKLMKIFRERHKKFPIIVSTIAGIKNISDLNKYLDIKPKKIVLHHDVNRNFKDLKQIISKCKDLDIIIEIMLTESCLRRCPYRSAHYKTLSTGENDRIFHFKCNTKKFLFLRELLKANSIRPEDLDIYEKMGISNFKITGRSKSAEWLPSVVKAYLNRNYDGNLIRLLGIDPLLKAEDLIFINNKSLNDFLHNFPKSGNLKEENKYCEGWVLKLFKNNLLKINDKTADYRIINNKVVCKKLGDEFHKIYLM